MIINVIKIQKRNVLRFFSEIIQTKGMIKIMIIITFRSKYG